MEKKVIKLRFDKSLAGLAGFEYGKKIYEEQARGKDFNAIEFPDHIELVALSFTQGFFSALIEKYGAEYVRNNVKIISAHADVANKVSTDIY